MPSIQRIPRESLREHVYRILQTAIVSGDLGPGERVRDQELAVRFGISRTPVREALQRLEDEGLVETVPGSLTRVTPLSHRSARDSFPVAASLHALATRLAVGRLTPEHRKAMAEANTALQHAIDAFDTSAAIAADDAFHNVLLAVADNIELQSALERVMPKVRRLEHAQFGSLAGRASVQQHKEILLACEQGDASTAARLVEENWLSLGRLLLQALAETEGGLTQDESC